MTTTTATETACRPWCEGPPSCTGGEHYSDLLTVAASAGRTDETWPPLASTRAVLLDDDTTPRVALVVEEAGQRGYEAEVHLTVDEAQALVTHLSTVLAMIEGGEQR